MYHTSEALRACLSPVRARGNDVRKATYRDKRAWLQGHENVWCFSNRTLFRRSAQVEYLSPHFSCLLSYRTSVITACFVRTSASRYKIYRPLGQFVLLWRINILSCVEWLETGFRLVIVFISRLQLGISSKHNVPQIIVTHAILLNLWNLQGLSPKTIVSAGSTVLAFRRHAIM